VGRSEQEQTRREKLDALKVKQIQPYGGRFPKEDSIQQLVAKYADRAAVSTAGRLTAKRGHGGLMFADLRDASGKIQICVKEDQVGEAAFRAFGKLDLGDILGSFAGIVRGASGLVSRVRPQKTEKSESDDSTPA